VATSFSLETTPDGVKVAGEIDLAVADALFDGLESAANVAGDLLVVDLTHVTFMDSTGIRALVQLSRRCPRTDFTILTSREVFSVFELAGLATAPWLNVEIRPPDGDTDTSGR
jgi:anti-anti-sigma factor